MEWKATMLKAALSEHVGYALSPPARDCSDQICVTKAPLLTPLKSEAAQKHLQESYSIAYTEMLLGLYYVAVVICT